MVAPVRPQRRSPSRNCWPRKAKPWGYTTPPNAAIVIGAILVTGLFALSAQAARDKLAATWLASAIVGFAVFLGFTFGVLLPHIEKGWPAARIAWVHALALHDLGRTREALARLGAAHRRFKGERSILAALAELSEAVGDAEGTARWRNALEAASAAW